ncbi:unnamed protein product [Angiostrongylus costaricensis]|uniref:BAH domain-containing protein n=1 Tax=Angiostrongylus costaricensis TaxID=334426 RepID=A0A0R3PDQ9_ANGCS|nr:unnamed protein product [Angiostrongylus costaricensis]
MATEAYEKVFVMVDKTVNSAGELLKRLQSRSPDRTQNEGVRIPSLVNVKCLDKSSGQGKNAAHGDVTIEHADNVYITCESDDALTVAKFPSVSRFTVVMPDNVAAQRHHLGILLLVFFWASIVTENKKVAHEIEVAKLTTKSKKLPESSTRSHSSSKRSASSIRDSSSKKFPTRTATNLKKATGPPSQSDSLLKEGVHYRDNKVTVPSSEKVKGSESQSDLSPKRCLLTKGPVDSYSKKLQKKTQTISTKKEKTSTATDPSSKTAVSDDSIALFSENIPPPVGKHVIVPSSRFPRLGKPVTRLEKKSTRKKKKQKKKSQFESGGPQSYLYLSNRYVVAGRKVKKHGDDDEAKKETKSKREIKKERKKTSDSVSTASTSSSSAEQFQQASETSTSINPVFEVLNIRKIGKRYPRQETKTAVTKRERKEQRTSSARKPVSCLDLSLNRYAIAGRRVKKTVESSSSLISSKTSNTGKAKTSKKGKTIDAVNTAKKAKRSTSKELKDHEVHTARAASTKSAISPVIDAEFLCQRRPRLATRALRKPQIRQHVHTKLRGPFRFQNGGKGVELTFLDYKKAH